MNRLAHSIDQTVTKIELNETINLLIGLTARIADMRGVQVDLQLPENPVKIPDGSFFFDEPSLAVPGFLNVRQRK